MGKIKVATPKEMDDAIDELIMLANKYHLSLYDLKKVYKDATSIIKAVNPTVLTIPIEIDC